MTISAEQFARLLPLASQWVREQETHILQRGVPLNETVSSFADARFAGVQQSEKVRVLSVARIPEPQQKVLREAMEAAQFFTSRAAGLTLGYGIYVVENHRENRALFVHELTHVAQYERLGIEEFLRHYLLQCLSVGYNNAPLELEAIAAAHRFQNPRL